MLTLKNKPWLLEVNHAPSFATESEVDRGAKYTVLKDTFSLLQLNPNRRKQYRRDMIQRAEARVMGNAVFKGGKLTGNKFVSGVKAAAMAAAAAGEKANGGGVEKSSSSSGTNSISSAAGGAEQITDAKEEHANEDDDDDAPIKSKDATAEGNENVDERNDENVEVDGEGVESAANPSEAAQEAAEGDSNALADDGEDQDGSCNNNKDKTSSQTEQAPTKVEKEPKKQEALSVFPGKPPKPPGGPKVAFGRSPNKDRNDNDIRDGMKETAPGAGKQQQQDGTTDRKTKSLHPSKMKLTKEEEKWPTVAVPVLREMTRESKDLDEEVLETTLFRKLYPPADIGAFVNGYGKFVDCAFDIWETLTGNHRRAQLLRSRARAAAPSLPSDHSKHPMSIQSKSEVLQQRPFSSSAGTNKAEDDGDDGGPPETELELLARVKNGERQKPLCIAGTGVGPTSSTRESSLMFDDHGSGAAGAAQPGAIAAVVADRLRSSMGSRIGNKVDHTRESATSGESSASALATANGHPPPQGGRVGTASSSSSVVRYHAMFDANQLQLGGNILRTQPALPPKVSVLDAPAAPKDGSAFPGGRASASGNAAASTNGGGASGVGASGLVGDDPQKKTTNRYAHLKPGDVVQVLTNLGWEKVVVRRKLESGRLDILFQDGETMHDVMPRLHDKVSSVLNSTRISSLQKMLPGWAGSFSPNKLGEGSSRRVSPQKGHFMDPAALIAKSSYPIGATDGSVQEKSALGTAANLLFGSSFKYRRAHLRGYRRHGVKAAYTVEHLGLAKLLEDLAEEEAPSPSLPLLVICDCQSLLSFLDRLLGTEVAGAEKDVHLVRVLENVAQKYKRVDIKFSPSHVGVDVNDLVDVVAALLHNHGVPAESTVPPLLSHEEVKAAVADVLEESELDAVCDLVDLKSKSSQIVRDLRLSRKKVREIYRLARGEGRWFQKTFTNLVGATRFKEPTCGGLLKRPCLSCGAPEDSWLHVLSCHEFPNRTALTKPAGLLDLLDVMHAAEEARREQGDTSASDADAHRG
eukprot:g20339.t1